MAKLDKVYSLVSKGNAESLLIQPASGVEWTIHNIYHSKGASIFKVEGAVEVEIDTATGSGSWSGFFFHVTNDSYLKITANENSCIVGYDGVITKEVT